MTRFNCNCKCSCTAAAIAVSAILAGLLVFFFTLMLTGTACVVRCFLDCTL